MNAIAHVIGRERAPDFIDNFFPWRSFAKQKGAGRAFQTIEVLVQFEDAAVVESQAFPNGVATLHDRIERADPRFVAMDQTAIDIDDQVAISLVELLEHLVLTCRMTISDASSDNHRSSFCSRGGVGPGRAQTGAAVSGRARASRARLGFYPGSPGSKTRSEHRFLFLFATVDLSGGFVYFVA